MWMWQDEGRTLFTLIVVIDLVWFALVLALVMMPEWWHHRAAKHAPVPMPVHARHDRKAA